MIAVLGALVALGPLTIDMYLPALPKIAEDLSVSSSVAQLTLTGTLTGLALGQLIVGPLSDSLGRRRPMMAGIVLHMRAQPAVVGQPRDRFAHRRMHTVRVIEEIAAVRRKRVMSFHQPAKRGFVHRFGMRALADLWKLLRIAKQHQVSGRRCDGDGVGQAVLAGLLDDEQIKAAPRDPARACEIPCGASDDTAVMVGDEVGVLLLVDLLPARVDAVLLLGHQ